MSDPTSIDEAANALASKLTPTGFVFERARQIQEVILPQLESQKAQVEEAIATYKIEMQVLEAASKVLPPDQIKIPKQPDNVVGFDAGGAN